MTTKLKDLVIVLLNDFLGKKTKIYSNKKHILAAIEWIKIAQDSNNDGGVSAYYSLISGWATSFIETTGYIIDTLLEASKYYQTEELNKRALIMGDFLLKHQNKDGSFISKNPLISNDTRPVIFDTGQDLLGVTALYEKTKKKKYLLSMLKAADFLCRVQDKNGNWLKYSYSRKNNTYQTRVAWALLRVYKNIPKAKYLIAAKLNLKWATKMQKVNGWFKNANFPPPNPSEPYTHTIGYIIEGFLESYLITKESKYLLICEKTSKIIRDYYLKHTFLPATFNENWQSDDKYTCLTGDAQFSIIWQKIYKLTNDNKYLIAARKMNNYLKSTQIVGTNSSKINGAIKGSYPIYGDILKNKGYCRMAYLNWATKFFIDTLMLEKQIQLDK